jgi:PilZ domain
MKERQPLPRRYDRSYARIPVELIAMSGENQDGQMGSVMDLSKGGLRVQTRPSLIRGQLLEVFLRGVTQPYAVCRVVWSHTQGSDLPCEAGLEILPEPPSAGDCDSDFLAELRGVYHNPAAYR